MPATRRAPAPTSPRLADILIWIQQVRARGDVRLGHLQADAITAGRKPFGFWLLQLLLRRPLFRLRLPFGLRLGLKLAHGDATVPESSPAYVSPGRRASRRLLEDARGRHFRRLGLDFRALARRPHRRAAGADFRFRRPRALRRCR